MAASDSTRPTGPLKITFGLLKGLCILVGLPLTALALMAVTGLVTAHGWARLIAGAVIALGLPLFLVDRALPDSDQERARGLATDLLALVWILIPLAFFGLAHAVTKNITAVEADRLAAAGWHRSARATYWLASMHPVAAKPVSTTSGTGKGTAKGDAGKLGGGKLAGGKPSSQPAKAPDAGLAGKKGTDAGNKSAKQPTKPAAPKLLDPAEIFSRFAPAVVSIRTNRGSGTGFLIDDLGTIATNHHVIAKAGSAQVKLKDGTWLRKVELLTEDAEVDLALLRVKLPKPQIKVVLGDASKIRVGERVIAIGNPLGLDHTLTDGLVSARRIYRNKKWIQMSVPISPGNSGGPVFNLHGEVVGIATAAIRAGLFSNSAQNLNLAVPVDALKKMIKNDYPKRHAIGAAASATW